MQEWCLLKYYWLCYFENYLIEITDEEMYFV